MSNILTHHFRHRKSGGFVSTDDLLYFMTLMVRKAEREPETSGKSLEHARRAFDRIVERMA